MKQVLKIFTVAAFAVGMSNLMACGDDSPNYINFDDSFEMVLSKASYSYWSKDSSLIVTPAACKASTLGYVVWEEKGVQRDTMKAYRSEDLASIRPLHVYTWDRYSYEGKDFPVGLWQDSKATKQTMQNAKRFLKKGVLESVFRYEGDCFASSLLNQLYKKNTSIVEADSAIAKFYMMFQSKNKQTLDTKTLLNDLRAPKCNKITMYDNDVSITMSNFKNNSGTVTLAYGKDACNIKFKIRHAIEKEDCEAAFTDFEKNKNASSKFNFDDYSEQVEYDVYCINRLVLDMQEDKQILPRVSGDFEDYSADEIARSIVKFVLGGMK